MLKTRLWMGASLIAILAAGLWLDQHIGPPYPCWLVISLVSVVGCCRELRLLLHRRAIRTSRVVSYGSVILIVLANWVPWVAGGTHQDRLAWPLAMACVANMVVLMREAFMFRQPGEAMVGVGGGLLVIFYIGVLGSFAIQLRWLEHGLLALGAHIAAVKCGDTGAYFGGRLLGRHKLCPSLSPNKTIEGALAGALASVVGTSLVVLGVEHLAGSAAGLLWWEIALFGLAVGILGQVGDLIESMIKRDCQQKDASAVVPGFGGLLDVLDSPLFSAPLAFALWIVLGPGWGGGAGAGSSATGPSPVFRQIAAVLGI